MSKKKTYFLILIILIVSVGMTLFLPNFVKTRSSAYADIADTILMSEFTDSNLYTKLQKVSTTGKSLNPNSFKDTTELDLSYTLTGAPDQSKRITDLTSLRKFDLRKLKKLVLSNNNITSIEADVFEGMTSLEYLDVSNNGLTSIDLSMLSNLKVLIINNNNLTTLDVSNMVTTGYEDGKSVLNVAHNQFDSFEDVNMPIARSDSNFDVIGYANNFTDIISLSSRFNYIFGLQGINKTTIEQSEDIKYYNTGDSDLQVKIYQITTDQNGDNIENLVKTITDGAESITNVELGVGNYRVDYFKNNTKIDNTNNEDCMWFESTSFSVVPTAPKYVFEVNGKQYTELDKLTQKAKLILVADEDATVYYAFNSTDWTEGREVTLDKGGKYFVQFKSVKNGVESKVSGVTINASLNLRVPDIFLVLLIVLVAGGFVVALYFIGKFLKRR